MSAHLPHSVSGRRVMCNLSQVQLEDSHINVLSLCPVCGVHVAYHRAHMFSASRSMPCADADASQVQPRHQFFTNFSDSGTSFAYHQPHQMSPELRPSTSTTSALVLSRPVPAIVLPWPAPVPIASTHVTCTRGPEPAAAAAASAAVAATHLAPSIAPEMSPPASPKQLPAVGSPFPVQLTELSATDTMPDPDPTFLNLPCPPQQTLRRALNEDEDLDLEAEFEIEAAEFEIRDEWILAIGLLFDTDSAVIRRAMLSTGMGTPRMIFFTSPAQVRILASLKTPLALGSVHTIMRTELGAVLHVSTYSNLLSKNTIVACAVVERADEAHYSAFFEEVLKYTDNKLTVPSRARANADEVDALSVAQQESAPGATSSQLPSSASHSSTPDHEVHLSRIPSTIPSLCWSAPLSAAQLSSRPSPSPPSQPSSSQVSSANNNVSSFPSLSSFCTTATTASCSASSLNLLSTATVPAANVLSAPPQSLPTSCATPAVSASVPTISSSASSSVAASPCSSSSSSSDSCSSSSSQNSARSNSTESSQLVLLQQYLPSMAIATLEPTESNVGEVWYALQWRGVTVDFSEAQINAVTASLNHAIRESNPSVPLDTVWCVVEQSVRGSCRLHYQQSCQRLLRSGVVVPAKMVVSVGARLRKITQVGTLTEVDEIISSLVRDCPAILPFLNWWTRARIARLLFRATAAAAIEGQSAASRTFSLPPTNNVAKSMGRSLQLSAHKLPLNLEETIGLLERETRYIEAQLLAIENNVLPHRKGKKRKKPVAPISD